MNIELLGNNYETNCFDYELDYKFANFNMRSDCISSCIRNIIKIECNITGLITIYGDMYKDNIVEHEQDRFDYENLDCQYKIFNSFKFKCQKGCKKDCSFKYYSYKFDPTYKNENNQDKFMILHNSKPDIEVIFLPKIIFLSIICNFGGLLGMWLGLSFIDIIDYITIPLINSIRITRIFNNFQNNFRLNVRPINIFINYRNPQSIN